MPSQTQRLLLVRVYTLDRFTPLCVDVCVRAPVSVRLCLPVHVCLHTMSLCVCMCCLRVFASTVTVHLQQGGICTPVVTHRCRDGCQNDRAQGKFLVKDRRELHTTATHPVLDPWQHQASLPNTTETQLLPPLRPSLVYFFLALISSSHCTSAAAMFFFFSTAFSSVQPRLTPSPDVEAACLFLTLPLPFLLGYLLLPNILCLFFFLLKWTFMCMHLYFVSFDVCFCTHKWRETR
ncbi:hypothetical protein AMECASPLE_002717 [Ameca splendens]|uniref:Uncharacterized protein n=1 Tax=Ameca splendens TaxID=208324 RepID=A0ABV0XMH2_9TELE